MEYAIESALSDIRGVKIDEAAVQAHVIRPSHVVDVLSSKGLEEGIPYPEFAFPISGTFPYDFDLDGFGKALHAALKDVVAGYVMQLWQHGRAIYGLQWNWAKRPWDGSEAWTPAVRMHIASCSKLVTAIAMTKLLDDKHMSYDTPIAGFLPSYWVKGPNVDKITFRHLMTHTSGFDTGKSDSDFEFMKNRVAAGVPGTGTYHYQNMNFGLCRILLSTVNGNIAPGANFTMSFLPNDVVWDYVTIQSYVQYIRDQVFAPAGATGPTLDHPANDALAYSFPVQAAGWNSGDLSSMSGGAGWHMSPDDILRIMDTFRRKGTIMSAAKAQTMLDNGFGIDLMMPTPIGNLYNKSGWWGNAGGQVEQSLAYFLPQDMELVVLANSPVASPAQLFRDIVTNIYIENIRPRLVLTKHL
jgi:CubicO group peptidase (beta-lactamase class C family)